MLVYIHTPVKTHNLVPVPLIHRGTDSKISKIHQWDQGESHVRKLHPHNGRPVTRMD